MYMKIDFHYQQPYNIFSISFAKALTETVVCKQCEEEGNKRITKDKRRKKSTKQPISAEITFSHQKALYLQARAYRKLHLVTRCTASELRSELSDLSDDDNAVNKTYESRILKGESSSDESYEEKMGILEMERQF
ncbi:hypothetical protein TNCV_2911361 [Trichonephila clavipes]|nr:hypothetical protein TNCV_2911361 [Trichonephila clavipes]